MVLIQNSLLRKIQKKINELKNKYDIGGKKFILDINSNFTKRKNLPLMLDTAKYLKKYDKNFCVLMVCKNQYFDTVKTMLRNKNVEDVFIHCSNLSDEELISHYHLCDFLAMPSTREGFGFPLIEALAVGKPFVSFDVGVASDLVSDGFGSIASDQADFKKKCLEMIKSPYMVYGESVDYIRRNYSWKNSSEKLIKIYEQLI